eukprot:12843568-Ditylum_brightwellii.AAC.1
MSRVSNSSHSNLKLELQNIVELSGKVEEWQKWKTQMQCALNGSGYERILLEREYTTRRHNLNRIVYLQLSVATSGGTVYHLVKQFEKEKNGHAGWSVL